MSDTVSTRHWARGALKRGFSTAAQNHYASSLALLLMLPEERRKSMNGNIQSLSGKIAYWENQIIKDDDQNDKPGLIRRCAAFLLRTTTYLAPVMVAGVALHFAAGPIAGIAAVGLLTTYMTLGEALIQTARKHKLELATGEALPDALQAQDFSTLARNNVLIKGALCGAFAVAAGPLARFLGGLTNEVVRGAQLTLGGLLSEQFLKSAQVSVIKSAYSSLTRKFADAAIGGGHGPATIIGKTAEALFIVRSATAGASALLDQEADDGKKPLPEAAPSPAAPQAGPG